MNIGQEKELKKDCEEFISLLGQFIRKERKLMGYSSAEEFANKVGVGASQLIEYENGTVGMNLKTFHKIFRGLNKTTEDILNESITKKSSEPKSEEFKLPNQLEQQVRIQLNQAIKDQAEHELNAEDLTRLYLMLIYCQNNKLKKTDLKKKFKLATYTPNFNKVLQAALDSKWITMTNPAGKNDKNQKYYTTEAGLLILKF